MKGESRVAVNNMLKVVLHWIGLGEEGTIQWNLMGSQATHTSTALSAAAGNVYAKFGASETPTSKLAFSALLWAAQQVDKISIYEYPDAAEPAATVGEHAITNWPGISSTGTPLQCCIVASTHTGTSGRSYNGRQYFPGNGLPVIAATGLLANSHADEVSLLAANMGIDVVAGVQESLSIDVLDWVVYSPKKHITTNITSVTVDNKFDTQRRREAGLAPTYLSTRTFTPQ